MRGAKDAGRHPFDLLHGKGLSEPPRDREHETTIGRFLVHFGTVRIVPANIDAPVPENLCNADIVVDVVEVVRIRAGGRTRALPLAS